MALDSSLITQMQARLVAVDHLFQRKLLRM